jgi:hypothetical protein
MTIPKTQSWRQRSVATLKKITLVAATALAAFSSPEAEAARGRVQIQNGNVVTDNGERLRAAPFFMSIFNTRHMRDNETTYRDYFRSVSRDYGMNCVRVCPWVGNWEYDIKNNTNHNSEMLYMIDKCVQWAEEDNIYVVINLHTKFGTVMNRTKVDEFWSVVAPRHKDKTHVVFEAVNEPDVPSAKSTMAGIYSDLRGRAANTHIILWSLADPGVTNNNFALSDLQAASSISYSNASFGFHIYDWQLADRRRWDKVKTYRDGGYPVINTELMSFQDADTIPIYYPYLTENIKHARESTYNMSWMQWAPRFNYASMDQYGDNHLTNSDIGFFQIYKDKLLEKGINFWSSSISITGNRRLNDSANTFYFHANGSTNGSKVTCKNLNTEWYSQRWAIESVSGATNIYRLKNLWGNIYLGTPNSSAGTTVQVETSNTSYWSQQWEFSNVGTNTYRIKNRWSGLYLTAASSESGDLKQQSLNTSSNAQIFRLTAF